MPPPPTPSLTDRLVGVERLSSMLVPEVQDLIKRMYSLEAAETVRGAGRTPRRRIEFRSQLGEDARVWELLATPADGFYIEVGAFDGFSFSVTYAFDAMGWDGLLIEPIPERYEQCVRNRPTARVVHAALGGPGSAGTTSFVVTDDDNGGMLSYRDQGAPVTPRGPVKASRKVTVPLTSMNELLKDHTREITLVVIDVEGSELELLKGFDLGKYRPRLLLIEDGTGETPVARYMATQAYVQLGWLEVNRIYVRSDLAGEIGPRMSGV